MPKPSNTTQKDQVTILGFGILLFLLVTSIVFYKQRMLFVDPSWVVFNIINTGTFSISEHRYTAVFTQIFPLIGSKFGWSIKSILMIYSASFYLLYSSIAWICWKKYGQSQWVLFLAMYLTLGVSDGYFWPNNEVHQGIAWMAMYFAFVTHHQKMRNFNFSRQAFAFGLGFLALFSHLLVSIPFAYFFIYYFAKHYKKVPNSGLVYAQIIGLAVIFGGRLYLSVNGWYDSQKLIGVSEFSTQKLIVAYSHGHIQSITTLFLKNYIELTLMAIVGVGYLLYQRNLLLAFHTLFFIAFYATLVLITYPDFFDRSLRFYFESEWMPLTLILVAPFVFKILPILQPRRAIIILMVVFACRLSSLYDSCHFFEKRYQNLQLLVKKEGHSNRLLTMTYGESTQLFIMPWGIPIETMLLSKMNGDQPLKTVKIVSPGFVDTLNTKMFYYSCFRAEKKAALNERYFKLADESYEAVNMNVR